MILLNRKLQLPFLLVAWVISVGGTLAQDMQPSSPFSDEQVHRVLMLALDNITRARCDNVKPCAAATAEEKTNPPVSISEARSIMHRGIISARAEHCGLDWQTRNYAPMLSYWRHGIRKSERQMALIGLIHGIVLGMLKSDARDV